MPTHPGWKLAENGKTVHAGHRGAAAPIGASGKVVTLYGTQGKPVAVKSGGGRVAALLKQGFTRQAPARSGGVSSTGHVGLQLPPGAPPVPAGRDPQIWANQMWLNYNAARGRYPAPNPYDWRFSTRGGYGPEPKGGSVGGDSGGGSGVSSGGGYGGGGRGSPGALSHGGPTYYANPSAGDQPIAPGDGGIVGGDGQGATYSFFALPKFSIENVEGGQVWSGNAPDWAAPGYGAAAASTSNWGSIAVPGSSPDLGGQMGGFDTGGGYE